MTLAEFLQEQGMTRKDLADQLGVTAGHLSAVSAGKVGASLKLREKFNKLFPEVSVEKFKLKPSEMPANTRVRLCDEGAIRLVEEIFKWAQGDYLEALKAQVSARDTEADRVVRQCERFYRSAWFQFLCLGQVDGEAVIREMRGMI